MKSNFKYRVGDWVEVRTKEEILRTLDSNGLLEGMPFMPEMLQYCGQRFRVHKRAHKTCDYSTLFPNHTRRLKDTVHLQTRCSGEAHDGCQSGCLLYWKHAWLKPVIASGTPLVEIGSAKASTQQGPAGCTEARLSECIRVPGSDPASPTYICQTTEIPRATTPLAPWDIRQYIEDYQSGNVSFSRLITGLIYAVYYRVSSARRLDYIGLGRFLRWLYNTFNPLWGGHLYPRLKGTIPVGQPTPNIKLNLQPGELVRVKSHREILQTVTTQNQNRGMSWDAELVPYCGKTYRVLRKVDRLIDEKTCKMLVMKSPCIALESVVCQARYSKCRMLCPKEMFPFWREIWLERVAPAQTPPLALQTSESNTGALCSKRSASLRS
jgi:hypothetical protein